MDEKNWNWEDIETIGRGLPNRDFEPVENVPLDQRPEYQDRFRDQSRERTDALPDPAVQPASFSPEYHSQDSIAPIESEGEDSPSDFDVSRVEEEIERLLDRRGKEAERSAIVENTEWPEKTIGYVLSSMAGQGRVEKVPTGEGQLVRLLYTKHVDGGSEEQEFDIDVDDVADRVTQLLEQNGGRLKQSNLAEETNLSPEVISHVLTTMDEENRVERLRLGREWLVTLTNPED